jgi:hypothetical protein
MIVGVRAGELESLPRFVPIPAASGPNRLVARFSGARRVEDRVTAR